MSEKDDFWDLGEVLPYKKDERGDFIHKSKTKFNCTREIICPAGSIILLHNRTMHSLVKNQKPGI